MGCIRSSEVFSDRTDTGAAQQVYRPDMRWKLSNPQHRLYILALAILVAGMASAVIIYLVAGEVPENVLISESEDFKKYTRQLELYGGTANVLAAEFMNWFKSLWHGKSLAYTVAVITIILSCGLFFVAYHMETDSKERK